MNQNRKIPSLTSIITGLIIIFSLVNCSEQGRYYANALRTSSFIQSYDTQKIDFLWVLDNSGSMSERRNYVKNNIQTFLNLLNRRKAVNYQMAVTDTDYFSHGGNLIDDGHGINVIKSTDTNPASGFEAMINNVTDSGTSFWEQGLEASYAALVNSGSEFLRSEATLALIYLTDENDFSCASGCFGPEPENNTGWAPHSIVRYSSYLRNITGSRTSEVVVFSIVGVSNEDCSIASLGERYSALTSAIGGVSFSGSICAEKIEETYQRIGRTMGDRGAKFVLEEPAISQGISVWVNNVRIPETDWIFDETENAIIFESNIPALNSKIDVIYSRQVNTNLSE